MQIKQKKDTEAAFVSNKETADFFARFFPVVILEKPLGICGTSFYGPSPPVTQPIVSVQTPITDFSGAK